MYEATEIALCWCPSGTIAPSTLRAPNQKSDITVVDAPALAPPHHAAASSLAGFTQIQRRLASGSLQQYWFSARYLAGPTSIVVPRIDAALIRFVDSDSHQLVAECLLRTLELFGGHDPSSATSITASR